MNILWLIMYVAFILAAVVIIVAGIGACVSDTRKKLAGDTSITWWTIGVYVAIVFGMVSGLFLVI